MSKSICKAFKPNRNDNLCTPRILVECLKPYFDSFLSRNYISVYKKITVWCPFDKENSEYVIFFKELGCNVIYSHIDYGQNFFEYEPEENYDIIVSNPPFSRKLDVFKRCNELGKPWVMLSNIMCLNYMEIGNYFADNPVQMLIPDKRVSFDGNPSSFCSGYFCRNFLGRDLEFCHLPHCNSGKDFVPSRMMGE
ncbi:MAG TPA: hypothetical protein DE117_07940 [Fervidobacterium sp.]|nr:hypothetical protein [Fervidobacterium sp.]